MSLWHFLAAVEGHGKAHWGLKDSNAAVDPLDLDMSDFEDKS